MGPRERQWRRARKLLSERNERWDCARRSRLLDQLHQKLQPEHVQFARYTDMGGVDGKRTKLARVSDEKHENGDRGCGTATEMCIHGKYWPEHQAVMEVHRAYAKPGRSECVRSTLLSRTIFALVVNQQARPCPASFELAVFVLLDWALS